MKQAKKEQFFRGLLMLGAMITICTAAALLHFIAEYFHDVNTVIGTH